MIADSAPREPVSEDGAFVDEGDACAPHSDSIGRDEPL